MPNRARTIEKITFLTYHNGTDVLMKERSKVVDETKRCIREGMISLLHEKEYSDIKMQEIAQRSNRQVSTESGYYVLT